MGFKSIDNWTKKHTSTGERHVSMINMAKSGEDQNAFSDEMLSVNTTSKPVKSVDETIRLKEPNKTGQTHMETKALVSQITEVPVFEKIEILGTEKVQHESVTDSAKKASELIGYFDSSQNNTSKTKTSKKSETRAVKSEEKKAKVKMGKTTANKVKDEEKQQKSQNRRSFPFNITKLTKSKASDRRRSTPKSNLSKASSCNDIVSQQQNEISVEEKPKDLLLREKQPRITQIGENTVDSQLSELSAELSAALATPALKLIDLDLPRDWNNDVSLVGRSLVPTDNRKGNGITDEMRGEATRI